MRESVLFYRSFDEAIELLSDEDQLKVYRAITKYGLYGTDPELDGVAGAVFLLAKPQIDANNRRYENGKKGGAPKGNQNATKSKKETTEEQPKDNLKTTKRQAKEKVKVKDKVKDNITPLTPLNETQTTMLERLTHGRAISSDVVKALREWIQYKSQRNERYKEAGMTALITQAVNNSARYGAQAVIDTINNSMASGYKGIIWDRLKRPPTKRFNNATERNYDMDALEKRLLATN